MAHVDEGTDTPSAQSRTQDKINSIGERLLLYFITISANIAALKESIRDAQKNKTRYDFLKKELKEQRQYLKNAQRIREKMRRVYDNQRHRSSGSSCSN